MEHVFGLMEITFIIHIIQISMSSTKSKPTGQYKKGNNSMKVFISQPMRDKTDEEIKAEREKAIQTIKEKYPNEEVEILDSFFEGAPHDVKPLWFLGKSFEILADADLAYFCREWNNYRGCNMEHMACRAYGIEIVEAE
jgi:hypothetical protein